MNTDTLLPMSSDSFSEIVLKIALCVVFLCLGSMLLHATACCIMAT